MPTLAPATLYPGTCLIEGTNLSIGRGTTLPFEIVGAPWIDARALADAMNALKLDGVRFRPMSFVPSADKFANEYCFGVQIHVIDRNAVRPVIMTLHLIQTIQRMYPGNFNWITASFNLLMGDTSVIDKISNASITNIVAGWSNAQAEFNRAREKYLIYN